MADHKCSKEDLLNYMRDDIKEIKSDVKLLLENKWSVIGSIKTIGSIAGLIAFVITCWIASKDLF